MVGADIKWNLLVHIKADRIKLPFVWLSNWIHGLHNSLDKTAEIARLDEVFALQSLWVKMENEKLLKRKRKFSRTWKSWNLMKLKVAEPFQFVLLYISAKSFLHIETAEAKLKSFQCRYAQNIHDWTERISARRFWENLEL